MPTTVYDFHAHFFGDNRRLMTDAEKSGYTPPSARPPSIAIPRE